MGHRSDPSEGSDQGFIFGEVIMDENENVGGYAVPVDPMDLLQCDSCQ